MTEDSLAATELETYNRDSTNTYGDSREIFLQNWLHFLQCALWS